MSTRTEPYNGRKAATSIRFVIVGAGLSGLATAFALKKAGHDCLVIEAASGIPKSPGAIHIPPNLTKIFSRWGIIEQLSKRASRPTGLQCLKYRSGQAFGSVKWNDLMRSATGEDYYLVYHADVINSLYQLALNNGVCIRFGCSVVAVDPDQPSVTLRSGEIIHCDVVVGADGQESVVRDTVLDYHDVGLPAGTAVFIGSVPLERVKDDPELEALVNSDNIHDWLGPDRSLLAVSVREAGKYIIYFVHPCNNPPISEEWTNSGNLESVKNQAADWDPRIQRLLNLIDQENTCDIKQVKRGPYEVWVHDSGRVVLVGDACHPMPTHAIQKAAMAVEDAAVLGEIFSRLESQENVGFMLSAYQELRQSRCNYVQEDDEKHNIYYFLRTSKVTDEGLGEPVEELRKKDPNKSIASEQLEKFWEIHTRLISYEVDLEVENWWKDFGPLMSPLQDRRLSDFLDLKITVVTEVEGDSEPREGPSETI